MRVLKIFILPFFVQVFYASQRGTAVWSASRSAMMARTSRHWRGVMLSQLLDTNIGRSARRFEGESRATILFIRRRKIVSTLAMTMPVEASRTIAGAARSARLCRWKHVSILSVVCACSLGDSRNATSVNDIRTILSSC